MTERYPGALYPNKYTELIIRSKDFVRDTLLGFAGKFLPIVIHKQIFRQRQVNQLTLELKQIGIYDRLSLKARESLIGICPPIYHPHELELLPPHLLERIRNS